MMSRSSASPIQDYTHPEEHITTSYDSNPGFKLCTKKKIIQISKVIKISAMTKRLAPYVRRYNNACLTFI